MTKDNLTPDRIDEVYDTVSHVLDGTGQFVKNPDFLCRIELTVTELKNILAALEFAKEMQWQPIETAPRGVSCLITNSKWVHQATLGKYVDGREDWAEFECWAVHDCEDQFYSVLIDPDDPTHWMPLPQPPKQQTEEE